MLLKIFADLDTEKIITVINLYNDFACELGERFRLAPRDFYSRYKDQILFALCFSEGEASQGLFNSLINFRKTRDYSMLPAPDMDQQPAWKKPIRFVVCGAFDDILKQLCETAA